MIKAELEQWLNSIFGLVVRPLKNQTTDTLSEDTIYYTLAGSPIEVRVPDGGDGTYSFHYGVTVLMRVPTDTDKIGWLSIKLADKDARIDNLQIELNDSTELIEDENINCQVISKNFAVTHSIDSGTLKEKINYLELTIEDS